MPICFVVHLFITIVNDGYLSVVTILASHIGGPGFDSRISQDFCFV